MPNQAVGAANSLGAALQQRWVVRLVEDNEGPSSCLGVDGDRLGTPVSIIHLCEWQLSITGMHCVLSVVTGGSRSCTTRLRVGRR